MCGKHGVNLRISGVACGDCPGGAVHRAHATARADDRVDPTGSPSFDFDHSRCAKFTNLDTGVASPAAGGVDHRGDWQAAADPAQPCQRARRGGCPGYFCLLVGWAYENPRAVRLNTTPGLAWRGR